MDAKTNIAYIEMGYEIRSIKEWEDDFWNDCFEFHEGGEGAEGRIKAYLYEFRRVCPGIISKHMEEEEVQCLKKRNESSI